LPGGDRDEEERGMRGCGVRRMKSIAEKEEDLETSLIDANAYVTALRPSNCFDMLA